ncbi:asparagine synthase (glutamine-hydrolyzing) [bacterium]|nr:asparagine synthase (glutamine-hydrolyzing) [bacterium]
MCGISGIFHLDNSFFNPESLLLMNNSIRHRGPDDEGFFLQSSTTCQLYSGDDSTSEIKKLYPHLRESSPSKIGLGFRRLSIIDLSQHGHQPMQDESKRYTMVFNGEIYNYLELREKLQNLGYKFRSNSDTEVLLNMYLEYKDNCFAMLNGMWALAIWDNELDKITLCRDRWGIKPLCYFYDEKRIIFASEEKQIIAAGIKVSPNYDMIYRYLNLGSMVRYGQETFYQEIKLVRPGTIMTITRDCLTSVSYYKMDINKFEKYDKSLEEATREYEHLFSEAVRLRMRSDVEVGSCLSGGLDSSAIVCQASQTTSKRIKTFSAYYDQGKDYDERKWIEIVNNAYGCEGHLLSPTDKEVAKEFAKITYLHDAPVIGSSPVSQYFVMKKAREKGVTVVLDGQGSDELTAGYNHAFYRYYADLIKQREFSRLSAELPEYLRYQQKGGHLAKLSKILFTLINKESTLYNYELKNLNPDVMISRYRQDILSEVEDLSCSKLSNFQFNLLRKIFLPSLLHFEDRNSMAFSIESRVPFLDVNLVEFAFSLPSHYKIKGAQGKYIHRQSLKNSVPEAIYNRKDKVNFSAPGEINWLRKAMKESLKTTINSPFFTKSKLFDTIKLGEIIHNYLLGDNKHATLVWKLYALGVWYNLNFTGNNE